MSPNRWFALEIVRALLPWNTLSQHDVGACYATGEGVSRDEQLALKWFRRAARRGHVESQYDLGLMYLYGEGIDQDPELGLRWLQMAAQAGERRAASVLASVFSEGLFGIPKDTDAAERWRKIGGES